MTQLSSTRKTVLSTIIIGIFLLYSLKLVQMQIFFYNKYEGKSTGNSIKIVEQTPLRGVLYDRNLNLMVDNIPSYTVRITPADYDTTMSPLLETMLSLPKTPFHTYCRNIKNTVSTIQYELKEGPVSKKLGGLKKIRNGCPGLIM